MNSLRAISILGTRGVPAGHGGFETFAEKFALHMQSKGWQVTVYCQADSGAPGPVIDEWRGIRRVTFASSSGAVGTMRFDWLCVMHAMRAQAVLLVLGYNTAVFSSLLRFTGHAVLTNMDGIEWKRAKWPWHGRIWLYLNEWVGALTSTKLIADHPDIAKHLRRRRAERDIVMIPYGADKVTQADSSSLADLGVRPGRYFLSIGRIEPENNILPMIRAFTSRPRDFDFVCLGKFEPEKSSYHAEVLEAGRNKVIFPGPIYEAERVQSLRFYAAAYCHGHSVGGTNPSLVESLGASSAVLGHDNGYNRWVAGPEQLYFKDEFDGAEAMTRIETDSEKAASMRAASAKRFDEAFRWLPILEQYEALCATYAGAKATAE